MTNKLLSDTPFKDMDLPPFVQRGLDDAGFSHCTPIQAQTLPIALSGQDVAGQAQTGTGKTAAFLVALYTHLERQPPPESRKDTQPRALVLAPTRELAIQIYEDSQLIGRHADFRVALIYGGTDYLKQRQQLEAGVDILIGTPGRIIDYFKQRVFDLRALQVMVLDEADRMFDLGFIKDIRFLLRRMTPPEQRLNMLFSATLSHRVLELAYEHMNSPELIKIETEKVTADRVRQVVYYPGNSEKIPLLLGLLRRDEPDRTMLFVNTKHVGERITAYLESNGHKAMLLSGDVPQKKRQRLIEDFKNGVYPLLVATDVASRGLHIADVSHVINYDLPQSEEDYVHRIGRTARVGTEGDAISFACEDYAFHLPEIEAYIGNKIPTAAVDADLLVEPQVHPKRKPRPPRSGRPRHKQADNNRSEGKPRRHRRPKPAATTG